MKRISILGSTGSIGTQTLDIVRLNDDVKVEALTAHKNIDLLEKQIREFHPRVAAIWEESDAKLLSDRIKDTDTKVYFGMDGLIEAATVKEADIVVTAVVGMIGIEPTVAAINAGKDIALAKFDTSKEKFLQGQSAAILVAGGGPSWLYKEIGKDYEKLYGRKFSDDIKVAPIFPCADGKKHYFIDTEAWSESYISSKVDEKKMAAICRLYDFLSSEEGKYLSFCGFEGEDYDIKDGKVVLKEGISLKDKYPYIKGASYICMWDPSSWDMSFPSVTPDEYRQWNVERHKQAVEEGSLPKYYDNVLFLSTPLKDSFVINAKDDLYQVMLGSEPVDKMVDDIMATYETKGLSKMIDEVNKKAEEVGIKQ